MSNISKIKLSGTSEVFDIVDKVSTYTAFEVSPHDSDFVAEDGTVLAPASMEHRTCIRSGASKKEDLDVVIAWGDGEVTDLATDEGYSFSWDEEENESTIVVGHIYSTPGKYIIKIYGKNYFGLAHDKSYISSGNYNLITRVFEDDLPIASHVTNLGSFLTESYILEKVMVAPYYNLGNVINFSNLFMRSNVVEVYGMKNMIFSVATAQNLFGGCKRLKYTDYTFPVVSSRGTLQRTFMNCTELETPISEFFPANGFTSGTLNVEYLFNNCKKAPAEDLTQYLWGNKNVKWTKFERAFTSCSTDLRAMVPTSWGGTNASMEAQLHIADPNYYSAVEVMPTKVAIPAGTVDETTGFAYNTEVSASTVHKMLIRIGDILENCDVVVDWGDGTYERINDGAHTSSNGHDYDLVHDYSSKMTEDTQKFIIKIYGKDYWCFRSKAAYAGANLISRIFDKDLPIAPHVANFNGMCYGADRLLKVHFYNYYQRVLDISNCFSKCKNLVKATGFGTIINDDNGTGQALFENCGALEETDFRFPSGVSELSTTFNGCTKLAQDINSFLPENGFEKKRIAIGGTFGNCKSLTGDSFGGKLWEDGTVKWTVIPAGGVAGPFSGSALADKAPKAWGGTNTDIEVTPNINDRIAVLEDTVATLLVKLSDNN